MTVRRRSRRDLVIIALLALAAGGCSYRAPEVQTGSATLVEVAPDAAQFNVEIDLFNSNDVSLELREFEYSVNVNGKRVFSGKRSAEAALAPGASRLLALPAVVRFDQVSPDAQPPATVSWSIQGSLLYLTPDELAEILLDTRIWRPRVGFRGKGTLELPAVQTAAVSE